MEIVLLSVGKIITPWIHDGLELFESRISRYNKFTTIILPDIKNSKSLSKESIKEEEGRLIVESLNSSDFVVLLDERGKEYTSRELSLWFQKQMNAGRKRVVFVVGGPFGFSRGVYEKAHALLALSKMTFTHEMAKLILTEQIYRSLTILKGEPYHHD